MFGRNDPEPQDTGMIEDESSPAETKSEIRAKFVNPLRPSDPRPASGSPEAANPAAGADPDPDDTLDLAIAGEAPVFPEAAASQTTVLDPDPAPVTRDPDPAPVTRDPVPLTDAVPEPQSPAEPERLTPREGQVVIGEGVKIVGQIRDCRQIEIFGTVDGDLEVEDLLVHENGLLKGNVKADRAEVRGALDGEVCIKHLLDVKAGGSVSGKTEYGELAIAPGGRVVGTLDDGSAKATKPASLSSYSAGSTGERFASEV